jgi:hypothetical protein
VPPPSQRQRSAGTCVAARCQQPGAARCQQPGGDSVVACGDREIQSRGTVVGNERLPVGGGIGSKKQRRHRGFSGVKSGCSLDCPIRLIQRLFKGM